MKLSEELRERGFIYQCSSDDLGAVLDGEPRTVYLGIDPTADAIHVGNLVPYMLLNRLMLAGHRVILLMGGGTALIGDPGGKSEERPFVDAAVIAEQTAKMEASIRRFVTGDVTFVNNYDWLSKLSMMDYLRDVGKHFTVNSMIKKDIVANRLTEDNSISYTEFSYSLLQAYDYHHLFKTHNCTLQIGGSDQWSNIVAGVDYIRRTEGAEVYALTMPLVVDKATGKKFGKTEGNAIWLNAEKTSPYAFYQFWLNTSDESVVEYLKLFTMLTLEEIATIDADWQRDPGSRSAQQRLALEVTTFVHGAETANKAARVSATLFGETHITELSAEEVSLLKNTAPCATVPAGTPLIDALIASELATSKREARTFIESGAVQLNNEKVTDTEKVLTKDAGATQLLKRGKKQYSLIELS
ncbi:tyrosine--tRNA ligase [bacterium]|nr:tyrosine--tRNA ligase [bacterium]|tara:strand:- start:1851 stop:3089 length:1239 start_codon:yes stop_codon:yes gene_type:complete